MHRWLPALALVVGLAGGCEPSCEQTCRKVLRCDGLEADLVVLDECQASCVFQEDLYERRDDDPRREAFAEHKTCLRQESCEAIADGACYDPELFVF